MEISLTPQARKVLASTLPNYLEHRVGIAVRTFQILFVNHPEMRAFFASAEDQPQKLASAIAMLVERIDQPMVIENIVERIVSTHTQAGVQRHHYEYFCEAVVVALQEEIGISREEKKAWREFFQVLTSMLAELEAEEYQRQDKSARVKELGFVVS